MSERKHDHDLTRHWSGSWRLCRKCGLSESAILQMQWWKCEGDVIHGEPKGGDADVVGLHKGRHTKPDESTPPDVSRGPRCGVCGKLWSDQFHEEAVGEAYRYRKALEEIRDYPDATVEPPSTAMRAIATRALEEG